MADRESDNRLATRDAFPAATTPAVQTRPRPAPSGAASPHPGAFHTTPIATSNPGDKELIPGHCRTLPKPSNPTGRPPAPRAKPCDRHPTGSLDQPTSPRSPRKATPANDRFLFVNGSVKITSASLSVWTENETSAHCLCKSRSMRRPFLLLANGPAKVSKSPCRSGVASFD